MITFLDENDVEYGALATFKATNAVNGERSLTGTIVSGDYVLSNIERGWRLRFDDEYFVVTYAKPIDEGRDVQVEFDAVHQFFWDFDKSSVYDQLSDGSHTFRAYLDFIFKNSGYSYTVDSALNVHAFEKQSFGFKKRLTLFNDTITSTGVEFQVNGKVVRILEKVGTDLSTVVRKNFNMNELTIEKNIGDFVTYQKGFGAYFDEEDHSKGRLEVEYTSPLASVYGKLEAEPFVDERYTQSSSLLAALKETVDNSYAISVSLDMEDLTRAGYKYKQPIAGDYIMAINETLGFQEKIRIVSFTSEYDVQGILVKHAVTCNDIGSVKKLSASYTHTQHQAANAEANANTAYEYANKALISADGKNTNYYGDSFPVDNPKGTLKKGDLLFLTVGDTVKQYYWNGADWIINPVLDDVEAFKEQIAEELKDVPNREEFENKIAEELATSKAEITTQIETAKTQAESNAKEYADTINDETAKVAELANAAADEIKADLVNVKNDLTSTSLVANNTQAAVAEVNTKVDGAKAELTQAKQDLINVASELNTAKQDLADSVTAVNTKVDSAKAELTQAKQDLINVASELNTAKQDLADSVTAVNTKVDSAKEELTQAKQQLTTVSDDLSQAKTDLQNAVSAVDTKAANLQSDLSKAKQDLTSQAQQLQTQANAQSELTKRVSSVEKTANGTKTTVSELSKTVAQNGKDITSVTNRTKTVEDDLAGTKTTLSQVKTTADSTSQKTATLESGLDGLSAKFDNLNVGGTNVIKQSTAQKGLRLGISADLINDDSHMLTDWIKIEPSTVYTLTTYEDVNEAAMYYSLAWYSTNNADYSGWISRPTGAASSADLKGGKQYTSPANAAYAKVSYPINYPKVKLERGNISTDYSQNGVDLEQKVAEYKQNADQNYASLSSTVQTLDGQVQSNKTTAEQTAQGFKTRIESLETYKDGESTRANQYFESAKTETARQLTAERTAIAKDYVAKSTYTSDVTGIRNDLSATTTTANTTKTNLANYQASNDKVVASLKSSLQTTDGNVSNLQTKVEAVPGQITSAVSAVEEKISTSVGGRNLWVQSKATGNFVEETLPNNHVTGQKKCYRISNYQQLYFNIEPDFSPKLYQKVTFSAWVKYENVVQGDNSWNKFNCFKHDLYYKNSSTGATSNANHLTLEGFTGTSDWKRITYTYDYSANKSYDQLKTSIKFNLENVRSGTAWVTGVKVELGSIQSDYTPAPEDTAEQISNLSSEIKQTADGMTLLATKTELNTAKNDLQSGITTATNKANAAQSASNANAQIISTHTTQISALNTGLSAKVSQSDFNTLSGRVTTAENNITAKANELTSKITSVEGKIPTSVGGRNLWVQSKATGNFVEETLPDNHITGQKKCYRISNNNQLAFNIEPDFSSRLYQKVTFSAWVKYDNVVQGENSWNKFNCFKHDLYYKNSSTGVTSTVDHLAFGGFTGTSDWKYITYTYDYAANKSYDQLKTSLKFNLENVRSGTAWVTGIKVEIGSIPSDYSPAPEDTAEQISSLSSEIKQTADGMTLLATKTELNSAKTELQSGITTATNKANAAQNTANSAQSTANNNAQTISTHTTQISALNTGLQAKVSQTDFNTLSGRVTSAENNITAKANELSSKITSVESKIPTEIGAVNLFKGSRDFSGTGWIGSAGVYVEDYKGVRIFKKNSMWSGHSQEFEAKAGEEYVFSAYVKSSAETDRVTFYLPHPSKQPTATGFVGFDSANRQNDVSFDLTDKYQRIAIKIKITKDGWIAPRIERSNSDAYLFFGGYKLERGNLPSDWTPAPEDAQSDITKLSSEIKQTADGMTLLATKTELNSAKNDLQSGITTATNKANTAQSTADSAVTKANTAQGTADSAVTKANAAQNKANSNAQTISTHTTQISALNTGLSAKVSQTDFNTLSGRVTTAENNITAKANELSSKITSVEGKIPTSIGGTNLLLYSADPWKAPNDYYQFDGVTKTDKTLNGSVVYKTQTAWSSLRLNLGKQLIDRRIVKIGEEFTYSIWMRTDQTPMKVRLYARFLGQSGAEALGEIALTNDWQKFSVTFKVTQKMVASQTKLSWFGFEQTTNAESGKYVYYACNKLERGNIATGYSPAPEDTATQISSLSSQIQQTADGITLLATKTELNTAKNDLQSGITTATNKANAAQNTANSAQSTANNNAQTISTHTTQISALNTGLSAKVSQSDFNTLSGRVTTAENNITAKANELSSKITSVEGAIEDTQSDITKLSSEIKQTADGMTLLATKTELNTAKNDLQSGITTATNKANAAQNKANSNAQTISTHTTQISALNTGLSAKVSQTDFNTLSGRVTTAENNITAKANELSSKITSVEGKIPTSIGGTNLLLYSADPWKAPNDYYQFDGVTKTDKTLNGSVVYKTQTAWSSLRLNLGKQLIDRRIVKIGEEFTYSIWMRTDQTPMKVRLFARFSGQSNAERLTDDIALANEWQKFSVTFKVTEKMVASQTKLSWFGFEQTSNSENGKFVYYACNKLERGNIATGYSPAPEDTATQISSLSSEFKQTTDAIKASVSSLDSSTVKSSSLTINADGIVMKAGKSTTDVANAIGSYFAVNQNAINLFSDKINVKGNMIVNGAITSDKIASKSINTAHLNGKIITADVIATNAITADAIKAGAVTTDKMSANSINGDRITAGTLDAAKIKAGSITASQIASGTITSNQIKAGGISAANIAAGAITGDKIAAGAIDANKIAANAITANMIRGGQLNSTNGATVFDLNAGTLTFNNNYGYIQRVASDKVFEITTHLSTTSGSQEFLTSAFNIRKSDNSRQAGVKFTLYNTVENKPTAQAKMNADALILYDSQNTRLFSVHGRSTFAGGINTQGWGDIPIAKVHGGLVVNDIGIGSHTKSLLNIVEELCKKAGILWV